MAELASRPGFGNTYTLTHADVSRLSAEEHGWIAEVDRWLIAALDQLGLRPGRSSFLQQQPMGGQPGYGRGMMIADMLTPDMPADMGAMEDPGMADAGYDDMGGDFGGEF